MANYPSYEQTPFPTNGAVSSVSVSPYATTNIDGTFTVESTSVSQGVALDNAAYRNELCAGFVANTETKPLYGGLPIVANIAMRPGNFPTIVRRATTVNEITGFSVINQAPNMVITAGSNCPSIGAPGTISFFRLGSRAKIPLPIDPVLANLAGTPEPQYVTWDFNSNMLKAASAPASGQSIDDSSSTKSTKSSVSTKAAIDNGSSLSVVIRSIFTSGRLAYEDDKGNINWVEVNNDPSTTKRLLAVVQI